MQSNDNTVNKFLAPWFVGGSPYYRNVYRAYDNKDGLGEMRILICQMEVQGNHDSDQLERAKLIAAAPDLLDALKDMVCLVLSEFGDSSTTYQNAVKAIAKAEGRANV